MLLLTILLLAAEERAAGVYKTLSCSGNLSKLGPGEAAKRSAFRSYRNNAKRGFELTFEQFVAICSEEREPPNDGYSREVRL
jgi:hypothetical protein